MTWYLAIVLFLLLPIVAGSLFFLPFVMMYSTEYVSCLPTIFLTLLIELLVILALIFPKVRLPFFWWSATLLTLLPIPAVLGFTNWTGNIDYALAWRYIVVPISVAGAALSLVAMRLMWVRVRR
jgi:hypothetical protein